MSTSTVKLKAPVFIAIAVLIVGILFKIMHWPYANWLLNIGACAVSFFYFLRFLAKPEKVKLDYAKLAVVISFFIRFIVYIFHFPGRVVTSAIFLISLGVFVSLSIGLPFFQNKTNEDGSTQTQSNADITKNVIVIIGIFAVVIGSISKIMHWPGANISLVIGLIIIAAWAILDLLLSKD
ncbi:MAG: hypothetical protein ACI8ZM_004241 [Crocinitomix sp.]|jgi:hypothetical protein